MAEASDHDLAGRLWADLQGGKPANIALMRLIMEASSRPEVEHAIEIAMAGFAPLSPAGLADRFREVVWLWQTHPDAWNVIHSVTDTVRHDGAGTPLTILECAGVFDRVAATAPEASVALYSFGNPALLEAATAEIVEWLRDLDLLTPLTRVLDIGCGSGRVLRALAPDVAQVTGIDISHEMIRLAQQRCRGLGNVRLARASGEDLAGWSDAAFELALAVDVLPYVVRLGPLLVRKYVADMARVLKHRGTLVVLNFSYRGDLDQDRRELTTLAAELGFEIFQDGTSPFKLWDGTAFVLAKRGCNDS